MAPRQFIWGLMLVLAGTGAAFGQLTLPQFIDCVGANVGNYLSTCVLQYNSTPYAVSSAISVTRSNITIEGSGTWPNLPILQRAAGGTPFAILDVTGSDVTIQDLIIDGNRFGAGLSLNCLGDTTWYDVKGDFAPHLKVQYVQFNNAPGIALVLPSTTASTSDNDVYVYNSLFEYSRNVAIYASQNSVVDYNTIEYSGINGVSTNGGGELVEYNTFYQNHDEWWAGDTGGQLIVYEDNVTVIDNYFDGNDAFCGGSGCSPEGCFVSVGSGGAGTSGIELYGANGSYTNNEIKNHQQQAGMGSGSDINGITINGKDSGYTAYWIHDNGSGIAFAGGTGTWTFTDLVSINNNDSGADYGAYMPSNSGPSINWGSGACLTGNDAGAYDLGSGWGAPSSTSYGCP